MSALLIIFQVTIGDAAIHLLVDDSAAKDNSTDPAEWPVIYRAVLIDGGLTTGKEPIKACIERIENNYTFAPTKTKGKLKFDSVILTHWDVDHWGGLKDLLQESISDYLNTRTDLTALKTASEASKKDQIKQLAVTVAGLQLPLFKYAGGEPATVFRSAPASGPAPDPTAIAPATLLTTFYIPYIDTNRSDNFRLGTDKSDSRPKVSMSSKTFICNHGIGGAGGGSYTPGGPNTLGLLGYYTYKIGSGKATKKGFKFFDLCNVVANYSEYVGVDVFYNKPLPAGTYANIKNPGQLMKAHSLTTSMGPRMFIVAGDQVILGNTPLAASATVAAPVKATPPKGKADFVTHPIVRIVDEKSASLGKRYTGVRNTPAAMNCPSIACLILSSTTDTPATIDAAAEGTSWKLWHFMVSVLPWQVPWAVRSLK